LTSKIYVTGAAGMIGSVFCKEAVHNGYHVVGIDNLSRGSIQNLQLLLESDLFKFVYSDISSDLDWANDLTDSDVIVHLADIVGGIGYVFSNEWEIFNKNLRINSNLARVLNLRKPRQLVYIGTACSYPQSMQKSIDNSGLKENDKFPADPESGYGWSKLIGDIEYKMLCKSKGIIYTNIDLHNVYGSPCDYNPATAQVIPALIYKALTSDQLVLWGNGEQGRAFVEVRDVAAAIMSSIDVGVSGSYMIGPQFCTTINDLVKIVLSNPKVKAKTVANDLSKPVGDIGRYYAGTAAFDVLGWKPKVSMEEGISDLIDYISNKI
jgi:GDP-D-mannose 3',5'-epimerase